LTATLLFSFNQAGGVPARFALKLAVPVPDERIFRATMAQL
jgi:hypothetical protein